MTSTGTELTQNPAFALRLSQALTGTELTLGRISDHLTAAGTPVSVATLSNWQTGKNTPRRANSLRAVEELERVLSLPSGSLRQTLARGEEDQGEPVRPTMGELERALTSLELTAQNLRGISSADLVVIGARRNERSVAHHQLAAARVDGLRRIPAIYFQDADGPAAPRIRAISGCRVGRQIKVPEAHLVVAELILPRALARDELHAFCYQVICAPTEAPCFRFQRALHSRQRDFVVNVIFRGQPPARATRYYQRREPTAWPPAPEETLAVPGDPLRIQEGQLQLSLLDAPIGVHGLSWQWD
ncbi:MULTISPECIES: hypothetical protein [unclassified Luteococcus]|uniref:hypothetical protein n=1 Tax=unclassified Luteococcus TaxID=2639923 RepID=UPI00313CB036